MERTIGKTLREQKISAGVGRESQKIIARIDFAIVDFCRVKEVKPFPVVASAGSLNELII